MSKLTPNDVHSSHDVREMDSIGIACRECGASVYDNPEALMRQCKGPSRPTVIQMKEPAR